MTICAVENPHFSAQGPHLVSGHYIRKHRYRAFPSLQKVLLGSADKLRVCVAYSNLLGADIKEIGVYPPKLQPEVCREALVTAKGNDILLWDYTVTAQLWN